MLTDQIQPQALTGNRVLDELHGLTPPAKAALIQGVDNHIASQQQPAEASIPGMIGVKPSMLQAPGMQAPGAIPTGPQAAAPSFPGAIPVPPQPLAAPKPPAGQIPIPTAPPTASQNELARVEKPALPSSDPRSHTKADTGQTGIGQIKSPWARIPLGILDAVGSGLFPNIAMGIPGTSAHHQLVVNRDRAAVGDEESERAAADKSRLTQAQAIEQESLPELHKTQAELNAEKVTHKNELDQANLGIKKSEEERKHDQGQAKIDQHLAASGQKRDENGQIIAQTYDELSEPLKAVYDWKVSQKELADAHAAMVTAQKDNIPAAQELARKRIENAQRNSGIAQQRLILSQNQFEMRSRGTQNGEALPGAMENDNGTPIGTAFQLNVRPTGQERNKAGLANSAHTQLNDLKHIVSTRPDIFGPAAGRTTDFTVWLGSQDPDAQRFRAARTIAGDHLAGVFGGRSEAALQALDAAIGHFKDNPEALAAGLDQLDTANAAFVKAGTVKTAGGSHSGAHPSAVPTVTTQAEFDKLPKGAVYMEDGKQYKKP